jgi:hypothetical protein
MQMLNTISKLVMEVNKSQKHVLKYLAEKEREEAQEGYFNF